MSEVCEDMEISREAQPEIKINFGKVEDLCVENEDGFLVRFGDIYKDKKTIIIFIRVCLYFASTCFDKLFMFAWQQKQSHITLAI